MKIHTKKCIQPFFRGVQSGDKTFEIRVNDCDYKKGDLIIQREFDQFDDTYSGQLTFHKIGDVTNFNQPPEFVVFSLLKPNAEEMIAMTFDFHGHR